MRETSIISLIIIILTVVTVVTVNGRIRKSKSKIDKYRATNTTHPCERDCSISIQSMECVYEFNVEIYRTMSRACKSCPSVSGDCNNPGCVIGDGVERGVISISRQIPGPDIQICKGDTVVVEVFNEIHDEVTAFHWHGLQQIGTPYMDGVPFVSQCPIAAYTSFTYNFTPPEDGTYFYHTHLGIQRADGLFGKLIIRQPQLLDEHGGLYDYDLPEHVVLVVDWQHSLMNTVFSELHKNMISPVPSIIVNGRGRYIDHIYGEEVTQTPYPVFVVEANSRYRFRFINSGSFNCPILFFIDNHNITVIAADGKNIEPVTVTSFVFQSGERFDFVLETNQPVDNYWMRFNGMTECLASMANQHAVLRYSGAPEVDPDENTDYVYGPPAGVVLNPPNAACSAEEICTADLNATTDPDPQILEEPDFKFYIEFDMNRVPNDNFYDEVFFPFEDEDVADQLKTPQTNNVSFIFPAAPPLSQPEDFDPSILCVDNDSPCPVEGEFCECLLMYSVPIGSLVEVILIDTGRGGQVSHPWHLHGFHFYLLGMDIIPDADSISRQLIIEMDNNGELKRDFDRPVLKDTVGVPNVGYSVFRFIANNPGYWPMHCHTLLHAIQGMDSLFQVGEQSDLPPVPDGFPTCRSYTPNRR